MRIIGDRKLCPHCGKYKTIGTEFGPHKNTKDGLQVWCRACRSKTNPKRRYTNRDDRFWKVLQSNLRQNGDCIEWTGRLSQGYPCITWLGKKNTMLRRIIFEKVHGALKQGDYVISTCGNNLCIRQGHLAKESRSEHFRRMHNAASDACIGDNNPSHRMPERYPRGSKVHTAILTKEQVLSLRAEYANGGIRYADLSEKYGISKTTVGDVIRRRSWTHI